jgi:transcription elongation factor Elf1
MVETIELGEFGLNFSYRCPKCDYQNEEISANDLSSGNAECGMCETRFKIEGVDAIKIIAILD